MYGMTVMVKCQNGDLDTMHNVTEVHYNFRSGREQTRRQKREVAFESDTHSSGCVYSIDNIVEMVIEPDTFIHERFI